MDTFISISDIKSRIGFCFWIFLFQQKQTENGNMKANFRWGEERGKGEKITAGHQRKQKSKLWFVLYLEFYDEKPTRFFSLGLKVLWRILRWGWFRTFRTRKHEVKWKNGKETWNILCFWTDSWDLRRIQNSGILASNGQKQNGSVGSTYSGAKHPKNIQSGLGSRTV